VSLPAPARAVFAGLDTSYVQLEDGRLLAAGWTTDGQCGHEGRVQTAFAVVSGTEQVDMVQAAGSCDTVLVQDRASS
jgi:hypothetical protein